MNNARVTKVVIVGGGTAGWMTAAALAQTLNLRACSIALVESDEIGIIGVGEATIPTIHWFNQLIGLDEREFMRKAQATYKLGIEFVDWTGRRATYLHPFGRYGFPADGISFQHRWIRARLEGSTEDFEKYSLSTAAARAGKFEFPANDPRTLLSTLGYAYHFDASLYARYLRERRPGLVPELGVHHLPALDDSEVRKAADAKVGSRLDGHLGVAFDDQQTSGRGRARRLLRAVVTVRQHGDFRPVQQRDAGRCAT